MGGYSGIAISNIAAQIKIPDVFDSSGNECVRNLYRIGQCSNSGSKNINLGIQLIHVLNVISFNHIF